MGGVLSVVVVGLRMAQRDNRQTRAVRLADDAGDRFARRQAAAEFMPAVIAAEPIGLAVVRLGSRGRLDRLACGRWDQRPRLHHPPELYATCS